LTITITTKNTTSWFYCGWIIFLKSHFIH